MVDWDGNGRVDEVISGSGQGVTVQHAFPHDGEQSVHVTARINRQRESFRATAAASVMVNVVQKQGANLAVGGTRAGDTIEFTSAGDGVVVNLNRESLGPFSVPGRLMAFGQEGDDVIEASNVSRRAEFHGGPGDDLLLGGEENDELRGESGADIIVGGFGNDAIFGDTGREILIHFRKPPAPLVSTHKAPPFPQQQKVHPQNGANVQRDPIRSPQWFDIHRDRHRGPF